jgi:hypothetical protein
MSVRTAPVDAGYNSLADAARAWADSHGVRDVPDLGLVGDLPRSMYCEHVLGHSAEDTVFTTRRGHPLTAIQQLGVRLLLHGLIERHCDTWYADRNWTACCGRCRWR